MSVIKCSEFMRQRRGLVLHEAEGSLWYGNGKLFVVGFSSRLRGNYGFRCAYSFDSFQEAVNFLRG